MGRGGCVDCGYNEHPAALHWDHLGDKLRPGQAFHPNWAWQRIMDEIAKCELVCANCHAVRTANRGYMGGRPMHGAERQPMTPLPRVKPIRDPRVPRHGTPHEYVHHGCRCDACKAAQSTYQREARLRRLGRL